MPNTLDALLAREAQGALWGAQAEGIHLWPLIRLHVLEAALRLERGAPPVPPAVQRRAALLGHLGKHARTAAFLLRPPRREYDALIFKPAPLARLFVPLYEQIAAPLIVEATVNKQADEALWRSGRAVLLEDTFKAAFYLRGRLRPLAPAARREIDAFAAYACEQFDVPAQRPLMAQMAAARAQRYHAWRELLLSRILPRLRSRLAFVHLASYMGIYAPLSRALRDHGCVVAELQHGMIGLTDRAYNHPPDAQAAGHPCRLYLPDALLTFGAYWGEQTRIPARKVPVGFPHLAASAARLRHLQPDPRAILIISQWTVIEELVALAVGLARALPGYRVRYKLHPAESPADARFDPLRAADVEIIAGGNIHDLIASSGIVVGYNSTALFEALAFPPRRLFLLDGLPFSDSVPAALGHKFRALDDLLAAIADPAAGYPAIDPRQFWADEPERRLAAFLAEQGQR